MSITQKLGKLRGRSLDEVRERLAQRLAALAERAGLRDAGEPSDARLRSALRPEWRGHDLAFVVRAVREGAHPRLAPGIDDLASTLATVRSRWPERVTELARTADDIVAGRFELLGHETLEIADPIDWSRDPLRDVRAPDAHWSTIAYLDPRVAGDHKLVWELSRHQFLVTLGQAYALTRRESYAVRAARLLESWMDANPPKRGINWASSLEVAYRSIAWLWALRFLAGSPVFGDGLVLRLLKFLEVSARHLERYLSTYFSPNTHLTGEALALLYLGTQLPMFEGAPRWRDRGWDILLAQLQRHVRPDGTYYEQATYYQRYTLDIYLHARLLGSAHGLGDVRCVDEALHRLATSTAWVARADGTIPLFGDEDGGRLLFLDGRPGDDVRASIATVAALLGDAALAQIGGAASDEVVWMLGRDGMARLDRLQQEGAGSGTLLAGGASTARDQRDGGLFTMRDGWEEDAAVLTLDCGPLGADNGGHAHADSLALDLAIGSTPVFVDAGTVSYTTSSAERDLMRSSLVHNTVSLDGVSSSVPAGPFRWDAMTHGVLDAWHSTPAGTLFEGHHDGYDRLPSPARHRRLVLAARRGWWLVRDVIEGDGVHDAVATFQCAPGLDLEAEGDTLRVLDDGRLFLSVRALGAEGTWRLDDGVASRRYGARERARRARFAFRTAPPATAVIFALIRGIGREWRVSHEREATASGLRETVRLHGDEVRDTVSFGASGNAEGVQTDARVAWVRRRASDGMVESLLAIGGTRLELDGTQLAEPAGGVVSAIRERGGWRVDRSDVREGPGPGAKP
ncbi:MAG: alginate lyase family protein [Gemmatimonadaceae bacterium]|nr:alginate lyase family protein [Gemmatimonadaceae bacterium]